MQPNIILPWNHKVRLSPLPAGGNHLSPHFWPSVCFSSPRGIWAHSHGGSPTSTSCLNRTRVLPTSQTASSACCLVFSGRRPWIRGMQLWRCTALHRVFSTLSSPSLHSLWRTYSPAMPFAGHGARSTPEPCMFSGARVPSSPGIPMCTQWLRTSTYLIIVLLFR